ncbi:MAG: hypothetical protein ACYCOU_00815 [Sulfobacillus sp.]
MRRCWQLQLPELTVIEGADSVYGLMFDDAVQVHLDLDRVVGLSKGIDPSFDA